MNTVKRYARMPEPQALRIAPAYRPTLVDPYRDHLRARRAAEPAVAVTHLGSHMRAISRRPQVLPGPPCSGLIVHQL